MTTTSPSTSIPTTPRRAWHRPQDRWQLLYSFGVMVAGSCKPTRSRWGNWYWRCGLSDLARNPRTYRPVSNRVEDASLRRIAPPAKAVTTPRKAKRTKSVKRKGRGE